MLSKAKWFSNPDIRPFIYMRRENLFSQPGSKHNCDWFTKDVLYKDPLKMSEVNFADQILKLEGLAFQSSDMRMPRWVFYDCAVVPGFVCGFAMKRESIDPDLLKTLDPPKDLEWVPISLFIIIPTVRYGEWVAHNLCTVNSVSEKTKYYALGFLTKAFGIWYANVEILCGMTQWTSPALKLHSHYGPFEILTAYTPVHSYPQTLTYRSNIDVNYWKSFFDRSLPDEKLYISEGYKVDPSNKNSLVEFQTKIEKDMGPFYLKASDVRRRSLNSLLDVYRLANKEE